MSRWNWRWVLVIGAVSGGITCGWKWWELRRFRSAMDEVRSQIANGRHAAAARNLGQLLTASGDPDEAAYLLGTCELARGRSSAALDAWARVSPGSPFSARAILARISVLVDGGKLAAAEQLINDAAADPRNDRTALRTLLLPTFVVEGRIEEALGLIEKRWAHLNEAGEGASAPAIDLARLQIEMRLKPQPPEAVLAALEQAGRLAPDDDRVWLGRANLAIRSGNPNEAERWLDLCQKHRPDDVPVWRARLSWGMATGRAEVVRQALTKLPAREEHPARAHQVRAWLAKHAGDRASERLELEGHAAVDPGNSIAATRLIELARLDHLPERVAELERRRSDIERMKARYAKLFDRHQPIRDSAEMGSLAVELGHSLEANVFLRVAAAESLDRAGARRALERFKRELVSVRETYGTLAELVATTEVAAAP